MVRTSSNLERRPNTLARTTAASDHAYGDSRRPLASAPRRRARSAPRRIGLFGLFGSGNSGNDGSLEAMLALLRQVRPDAEIVCLCAPQHRAAARIARTFQVAAVPFGVPPPHHRLVRALDRMLLSLPRRIPSLVRAIRQARRLDALIVPGTGILDDFWEGPLNMPLTLFVWSLAARLCGTRIAFVSIGAGPIEHPVSRWLMKSAVAMADYRSYRDTISKKFMESIGFDARKDGVYPDIAFHLPAPLHSDNQRPHRRLVVGVGAMTYAGWRKDPARGEAIYEAYLEKLTTFVLWLLDGGRAVRVLMGDADDQRAVNDLLANVSAARPDLATDRIVFDPISSLHDLMKQIGETDVVVATRYHNVVCALKMGKPTVSIGYSGKNEALMAEMGLRDFCQHVERLDLDLLIAQFNQLVADRRRYEQGIDRGLRVFAERLGDQEALLAARVLNPPAPYVVLDSKEFHS